MNIAFIGFGAVTRAVLRDLHSMPDISVSAVLVRSTPDPEEFRRTAGKAKFITHLEELDSHTSLVVECAGHEAVKAYGAFCLRQGIDFIASSVGSLANRTLSLELARAASEGGGRFLPIAGAIGGLEALRAAKHGDLQYVNYTGRKPLAAWSKEALAQSTPLAGNGELRIIFDGTADQAALCFPQNANVAAAIALAGIGFERTKVRLLADPSIKTNIHLLEAGGGFGKMTFEIANQPMSSNPKTSLMTAASILNEIEQWKACQ